MRYETPPKIHMFPQYAIESSICDDIIEAYIRRGPRYVGNSFLDVPKILNRPEEASSSRVRLIGTDVPSHIIHIRCCALRTNSRAFLDRSK